MIDFLNSDTTYDFTPPMSPASPERKPPGNWEDLPYCDDAQDFLVWAKARIEWAEKSVTHLKVVQVKLELVTKYFQWRAQATKPHRNRTAIGNHACLYHVFVGAWEELDTMELSLTPFNVLAQEKPQRASRQLAERKPAVHGIQLADLD